MKRLLAAVNSGFHFFRARRPQLSTLIFLALALSLMAMGPQAAPAADTWTFTDSLHTARFAHTATLLPNGKVMVAGGYKYNQDGIPTNLSSVELYDPVGGTWTHYPNDPQKNLATARTGHTATLLPNGQVLVAGGIHIGTGFLDSAELYDPADGTWTYTNGPMNTVRGGHTATLLPNGKVMVAGGINDSSILNSAELYDPATKHWTTISGSMNTARTVHTATLLPNGQVLVAGGRKMVNNIGTSVATAEIYDPANGPTGTWTGTGALHDARYEHTATLLPNGKVLVAGGIKEGLGDDRFLASAELYDPISGAWVYTGGDLSSPRSEHTATLLPNGQVLVAGGGNLDADLAIAELYDPANGPTGNWSATAPLHDTRWYHTATLLPNGKVLVAGGGFTAGGLNGTLASAELYASTTGTGTWTNTGDLHDTRLGHTATLLPTNGKVLVAGGGFMGVHLASAELYDPVAKTWAYTDNNLTDARRDHTATLLPNGKVLVAGGYKYQDGLQIYLKSAEIYDPVTAKWTPTGELRCPRYLHTATLLPNGKVLVAGGKNGNVSLNSAELYNSVDNSWTPAGDLKAPRAQHTATLLSNGMLLVAAGLGNNGAFLASAELYDPVANAWAYTDNDLTDARYLHAATLLPNGQVMVVGGSNTSIVSLASVELYDPANRKWTSIDPLKNLNTARRAHTATLLANGKVLAVAGLGISAFLSSAELYSCYNPGAGAWVNTSYPLNTDRAYHTATLLPNGQVLVAGGGNAGSSGLNPLRSAEIYDPGGDPAKRLVCPGVQLLLLD